MGGCGRDIFAGVNFTTMTQQEAEVILKVNDKQSREKLEGLEAKAKQLRAEFAEAFKKGDTQGIIKINRELQKTNKEINNMRINAANIRAAMVRLNEASPRELQRTITMINNELNSGRVKRGTKEWDEYVHKLKQVQAELRSVKKEMELDDDSGFFDSIKDKINDWGATAAAAMGAFAGVVMSGKAAVQAYADMQAEEANVRKFTGMTADEVARLNAEFKKLDTRTSREDLNKLAQEAGRLGKTSVEDVLGFVKAADQINVALDDLGEGATLTLSKLTGIFGDEAVYGTEKSLLKVGSVINELSQNCSASAPYLAEFSSRLGGIAAQSKMTISQIMAFAAVLDTQNLAVEASATAMGQLITKIYQAPADIAKAAQLDVKKFSAMVKSDMNGALVMLFEHLNKFGGMETLATVFDEMGTDGARAIPVLAALAGHVEELKWQQTEANKAFAEGISVTNEFDVQNNTVQAGLDKARKGFTEVAVALGEELLPVMRYCISGTSMLMRTMLSLINLIKGNIPVIVTLVSTLTAYTVAIKLNTAATLANNVATALITKATAAWRLVVLATSAAVNAMTGHTTRAAAAWKLLTASLAINPVTAMITGLTALAGALWIYGDKAKKAKEEQARLREEQRQFKKSISDISEASEKYAQQESARLKMLYRAATSDKEAKEKRAKAAKELIATYPDYFKNLTEEQIMLGQAKSQYDKLTESILENARARAASELVYQNQMKVLEIEAKIREEEEAQLRLARERDLAKKKSDSTPDATGTLAGGVAQHAAYAKAMNDYIAAEDALIAKGNEVQALYEQREQLVDASERLVNEFGASTIAENTKSEVSDTIDYVEKETDKERRAREKAEREELRKRKEALKQELDERKSAYNQAEAVNLTLYVTGEQDYLAYCNKREELEQTYVDDVVAIHVRHNKLDIAAYGDALKSKANLLKKHQDEQRNRSLKELKQEHSDTTDALIRAYHDPSGPDFQNAKLLNQMLLEEDIRYLQEKAKLYLEGSEEREAVEREITERVEQDKLDKQKEMAQALMQFEQEYRRSSGSRREQMELEMLAELHKAELISEEEYLKALEAIRNKYRKEDEEKDKNTDPIKEKYEKAKELASDLNSEYSMMILNLAESFERFFKNLGISGKKTWGNLSEFATGAFATISAGLSQYSAYANAERDLELAKIEKRYDKEIAAAGKNEKKKAALEKKKEAEVAKIKKKYNDKAMKIELAQAVAQTAVAAIAAYASASKQAWWLGPIAAAMATAAGALQIATIKKQHEAQAAGYYEGGFTSKDPNDRKEVGVVHANEFVANHEAVANPALAPVLRLIDHAQRNNTVGSLTATDVSRAIGTTRLGVGAGGAGDTSATAEALAGSVALMADINAATRSAIDRLSDNLENGIESYMVMDGENGFHNKYEHFKKLRSNPKR